MLLSPSHCFDEQMGFRLPIAGDLRVAESVILLRVATTSKQTQDGSQRVLKSFRLTVVKLTVAAHQLALMLLFGYCVVYTSAS